jgi:tetratricopeptide (TPR) repeat protein
VLSVLADAENRCTDAFELFGISRICERRGESARARILFQRSIDGELPLETARAARRSLAIMAKRDGDFEQARELWESMLGVSREGLEAYEQLAIYYERHAREPHEALSITKKGMAELRRGNRAGAVGTSLYKRSRARFERRLSRLERKASRLPLVPMKSESSLVPKESN